MTDAADELAHVIRELIDEAVARGAGRRRPRSPNLTEEQLYEYLRRSEELPVS